MRAEPWGALSMDTYVVNVFVLAVGSDKETLALSALRVRLLRLYCFDLFGIAELSGVSTAPDADNDDQGDDEQDDEAESTVLPLAVRMGLSGFYEDVSDADTACKVSLTRH